MWQPILLGEASGSHHRKHALRLFSAGSRWIWRPSAPKSPANFSSMKLESGQVPAVFFTVTCSYTVHNLRTLLSCSWEKHTETSGCSVWALHHLHLNPNISKPFTASRVFRRSGHGVISATSVAFSLGTGHPHTPIRGRCSCASSANNQSVTDLSQVLLSWIWTRSHGGSASRMGTKMPPRLDNEKLQVEVEVSWITSHCMPTVRQNHHSKCARVMDGESFTKNMMLHVPSDQFLSPLYPHYMSW